MVLALQRREALEYRDALARAHLDNRLLPSPRAAAGDAAALRLGLHAQRPDLDDVDVEQRLHRLADLGLVGVGMDTEGVTVGGREHVALLGDDRADDDLGVLHHCSLAAPERDEAVRAVSACSATSVISSEAAPMSSVTPTSEASATTTRSRLRNDRAAADSSAPSTTGVGRG